MEELNGESAARQGSTVERAAKIAATGISTDVAPALAEAIKRLATPLEGGAEDLRQHLLYVAVSLQRVEGVLREAEVQRPAGRGKGPARFDISDGPQRDPGSSTDGGGAAKTEEGAGRRPPTAAAPRWVRPAANGPWQKVAGTTSEQAVEEARRAVRRRLGEEADAGVDAEPMEGQTSGELARAAGGGVGSVGATTNDLGEAERREGQAAGLQFRQSQEQQQRILGAQQQQAEEQLRQQRWQRQQEEMQRHQAEMEKAAAERVEEERRQREALIASMSPQELARAAELHAQQAAVAANTFGTSQAQQSAGLVQQERVRQAAQVASAAGYHVDVEELMEMSPEEFATWEGGIDR